jgi:large repetitive protein
VQTVAKANSTTTLTGPMSPLNVGQSATFTATVTPSTATGTVQFLDGALAIGTVAVNGGTAVLSTTALAAGSHSITAAYSGDGAMNPSTSAAVAVQVVKYATITTLTTDTGISVFSAEVPLTATVSPSGASGIVQFYDGTALLGSATLVNGHAFLGVTTLTVGAHTLTAVYGGDAIFAGSTSPAVREMVAQSASTTTISATPAGQSTVGQLVTFTATVAPAAATGSVQFNDGNTAIGTGALVNGVATFSTSALKGGNHAITAAYLGDSNVAASVSAKLAYKVKP